jgi:hypothetical protein
MAGETYKPRSVRYRDGQPELRQHRRLPVTAPCLGCSISSVYRWRPGRFETRSRMNCSAGTPPTELQKAIAAFVGTTKEAGPVRRLPRRECMRSIAVARPQINGPAPIPIQALPPTGIRRGLYERIHDAPPRQPAGTALLSRRCGCAGGPTSTTSYTAASDNKFPLPKILGQAA